MTIPPIAIIILNWNGANDTLACLDSLTSLTHPNFNVIVVDNGSSDDSLALLRPYRAPYPLTLIETGANLGFAEGNNVGVRAALETGADAVLLLNNDTVVDPYLVSAFVDAAKLHPEGGVFSAKIFYHAEPDKLWYAGAKWLADEQHFQHVGIGEIDDRKRYEDVVETDYASGCALFIRAEVINKIGLMDPKFFLTYEESDWCYRARAADFKCLFVPGAKLWHKVSASFGGVESPLQIYFYSRNILLWAERYLPRAAYWSLFRKTLRNSIRFSMSPIEDGPLLKRWVWGCLSVWRRLRRDGDDVTGRARYLGFRDYLLRRFGDCPDEVRCLKVRG
ncbi:MAG: glycosyltransferase family 2 protein [Thiobacillus sp.]|nr:glycosyltransferase family 2 protein [Thiobacillus sp.]